MPLKDLEQRQKAIDPSCSYIVQAPAGSGKTELLTQRFLRLLGLVSAPEQIVALTFTKKAANEMRERILKALHLASVNTEGNSPHQIQTLHYAKLALTRDQALNWQLLQQPSRLRIITIDALCQRLTHAIPLQDNAISFPQISDTPDKHYMNAAKACLQFAIQTEAFQPAIRLMLEHVDNQQDLLASLFVNLLSKRDQWLEPLYQAKMTDKRSIEAALTYIEQHELNRFRSSLPNYLYIELAYLAKRVAEIEADPHSPRAIFRNWHNVEDFNGRLAASLASLLLTSQSTLRKSFDHHVGLKKGACDESEYQQLKTRSKQLLTQLEETPDFLVALLRVRSLPEPHYDNEQWNVLQALFTLLPLLAAHLNLSFNELHEVDFTAISQQALVALGDEDNPTELALYLDNTIQHLLVDEFQDTSIQQFQLLTHLVHGWQLGDGRTLFVVGDPMQSIYRFRAAEVGLFLRAKTEGIGSVILTPLQLSCNFRSTETIIHWINLQFERIFPQQDDIESGAVSFHPSEHTQSGNQESFISADEFTNSDEETDALLKVICHELNAHPTDNIAVLVRSRGQLATLLPRLREENIPFQGVEIDLLAALPHIRDVWSLTQALLMPANRLAWLSFLRSPWCGITLEDVYHLANYDKNNSIYLALLQRDNIPALSSDGRIRCNYIAQVLESAIAKRAQQSLVNWIMDTLRALHLEQILDNKAEEDLEQYWLLLERFEQDGQLPNLDEFYKNLIKLYSKQVTPSRLQIMTIHKSKGLEFDCVILPSLSKKPPSLDRPLLRWLKLPTPQNEPLFLMSPIKAANNEKCLLYDYLGKLDAQKNEYELQRLLYVAVTRAKKRLYLTDIKSNVSQASFRHLLQHAFTPPMEMPLGEIIEKEHPLPELYRLPLEFYQQEPGIQKTSYTTGKLTLIDNSAKVIGIVIHEILHWICTHSISQIEDIPAPFIKTRLRQQGIIGSAEPLALQKIQTQLIALFKCPIGKWLTQPHEDAKNEYELLIRKNNDIGTRIIDRTFVDKGIRWIVDFKTGQEHTEAQKKYRAQLDEYADILSHKYQDPIYCGLYYLATNHWEHWERSEPCIRQQDYDFCD